MSKFTRIFALFLAIFSLAIVARQLLHGCAAVPPEGRSVDIVAETALIIWDAESKTQHFIRRAMFDSQADDFGFLVPTPAKPELAEAHDYIFTMLEKYTAPEVVTRLRIIRPEPEMANGAAAAKAGMPPGGVQVVASQRVGDYDAVVLKADEANALNGWLKKHGYASNKHLTDWLTPYVKKQWLLTAFKINKEAKQQKRFGTSAVRMSFQTDEPFFPYREPANQRDPNGPRPPQRMLRVFLLATNQMQGTLGENQHWPGETVWSGFADRDQFDFVFHTLGIRDQLKNKTWWLTEFEDESSPRPGTDEVYFSTSDEQTEIRRPPIIRYITHREEMPGDVMPRDMFWLIIAAVLFACLFSNAILAWRLIQKSHR